MTTITEVKNARVSAEWFTPARYLEAARQVLGSIELDPASCAEANQTVKAARYFTAAENGLTRDWIAKTLWLNPPGTTSGRSGSAIWSEKLIEQYRRGNVQEAIFLVFNASGTETAWFQAMLGQFPICMVNHRIKFIAPAGTYTNPRKSQPVHGNAFVYMGSRPDRFTEVFRQFGKIIPAFEAVVPKLTHRETDLIPNLVGGSNIQKARFNAQIAEAIGQLDLARRHQRIAVAFERLEGGAA